MTEHHNSSAVTTGPLLPCPFCGGETLLGDTGTCWVRCASVDCGAEGPTRDNEADAVSAWNSRITNPAQCAAKPVAWRYRAIVEPNWEYEDRPLPADDFFRDEEGFEEEPLYAAQPPAAPVEQDDLLSRLVDWAYLHALEGAAWPSTKTKQMLIARARQDKPTQDHADGMKAVAPRSSAASASDTITEAWEVLDQHGFPPEACEYLPAAIDNALTAIIGARDDLLAEVTRMGEVIEPLRDQVGRALYEEPGSNADWHSLSEERREPWRKDADRVIPIVLSCGLKADLCALNSTQHPIERIWREVGLPEYFLGNGGTNHKLYALYELVRSHPIVGDGLDGQRRAQLEGLAIGLEQRGEKSAAHLIRTALLGSTLSSQDGAAP